MTTHVSLLGKGTDDYSSITTRERKTLLLKNPYSGKRRMTPQFSQLGKGKYHYSRIATRETGQNAGEVSLFEREPTRAPCCGQERREPGPPQRKSLC